MTNDERHQGGPERRMNPQRLEDINHQLDAYPLKDEAQRQRLLKAIQGDQPAAEGEQNPSDDVSFDEG